MVFQLDTPYINKGIQEPTVALDPEVLRRELAIGGHFVIETNACERRLGTLFRTVIEQLLAARHRLPRRPSGISVHYTSIKRGEAKPVLTPVTIGFDRRADREVDSCVTPPRPDL